MPTQKTSKKKNISFTFGDNTALEILLYELELLFPSMNKTEIAKLALIELRNSTLIRMGINVEFADAKLIQELKKSDFKLYTYQIKNNQDQTAVKADDNK
jgi:hypothetical protein